MTLLRVLCLALTIAASNAQIALPNATLTDETNCGERGTTAIDCSENLENGIHVRICDANGVCRCRAVSEEECAEYEGHCFQVDNGHNMVHQNSCCQTVSVMYQPIFFYVDGTIWTLVENNWVTVGRCRNPGEACGCHQFCTQRYRCHRFLVYKSERCEVKYIYVRLPDNCACA